MGKKKPSVEPVQSSGWLDSDNSLKYADSQEKQKCGASTE